MRGVAVIVGMVVIVMVMRMRIIVVMIMRVSVVLVGMMIVIMRVRVTVIMPARMTPVPGTLGVAFIGRHLILRCWVSASIGYPASPAIGRKAMRERLVKFLIGAV